MATFQILLKLSVCSSQLLHLEVLVGLTNLTQCQTNTFLPTLLLPPFPESHNLTPGRELIVVSHLSPTPCFLVENFHSCIFFASKILSFSCKCLSF